MSNPYFVQGFWLESSQENGRMGTFGLWNQ